MQRRGGVRGGDSKVVGVGQSNKGEIGVEEVDKGGVGGVLRGLLCWLALRVISCC